MGRLFWMFLGAGLGLYGRYKAKKTVERYVPPAVSKKVASSTKKFVVDVAKAQSDARKYLKDRKSDPEAPR